MTSIDLRRNFSYFFLSRTSCNYFYCCIQPDRLFYDAERDLLAIAKFQVLCADVRLTIKRFQIF